MSCGGLALCNCGRDCCAIAMWWTAFLCIWRLVGRTEIERARWDVSDVEIEYAREIGAL